ncbi:MAG: LysR family transcriptional regulator [Novosphingobium sp.]|nr:LysR family transcriptional regulator [Novosphingobium sp.]
MRFHGFDLNLLVVLDSLLKTRSVSDTARALNVTQPAISIALRKLREQFHDEILVLQGNVMIPTALAESLQDEVTKALLGLRSMLDNTGAFDPTTAERSFVIQATDYVIESFLVDALRRIDDDAPGIRIRVMPPVPESWLPLEQGEVDLTILPKQLLGPDHPTRFLVREEMVLLGCRSNPVMAQPPSQDDVERVSLVAAFFRGGFKARSGFAGLMSARKVTESSIIVGNFASIPTLLLGTNRMSIVPASLAMRFCRNFPLRIQPLPGAPVHVEEHLQFHKVRQNDAGLQWLVSRILAVVDSAKLDPLSS